MNLWRWDPHLAAGAPPDWSRRTRRGRASFDDVHQAPRLGWARLVRVEDTWALYRSSIGLRGCKPSGDWRNRGRGLELAAIALIPRLSVPGFELPREGQRRR